MFLMQHFNKTNPSGYLITCFFPPRENYHIALQKLQYRAEGTAHKARILECVAAGTRTSAVTNLNSITCTTLANRYSGNVTAMYLVTCSSTYTNAILHNVVSTAYNVTTKVITMDDPISVDANSLYFLMRDSSVADDFSNTRRSGGTIHLVANSTTLYEVSNALHVDSTRLGDPLIIEIDNATNAGTCIVCSALYYH